MRGRILLIVLVLAVTSLIDEADGRTWHVRQDSNADFEQIQPALEMAAPGDTILLGPGRFDEVYLPDWWSYWRVVAKVVCDDITLIGAGAGVTFVGPSSGQPYVFETQGIIARDGITGCRIEGMTIENFDYLIHWDGGLELRDCVLRGGGYGLYASSSDRILVEDVAFDEQAHVGMRVNCWSGVLHVSNCSFSHASYGLDVSRGDDVQIVNCLFQGNRTGLDCGWSSRVLLQGCGFQDMRFRSVQIRNCDGFEMRDCRLSSCEEPLFVHDSRLLGVDNIIPGGSEHTILIEHSVVRMQRSWIHNGGGYSVHAYADTGATPLILDFAHNWWGTSDEIQIRAWILDGNDDPQNSAFVEYRPYENQRIVDESLSWGDVKSLYR